MSVFIASIVSIGQVIAIVSAGHEFAGPTQSSDARPVSSGWYTSWANPPPVVSWEKFTHVTYAFAYVVN
jgi:GH18 family chitinase